VRFKRYMKIREVLNKKVGNKKYKRFIITLPREDVENSELIKKELEIVSKKGEIKLRKRKV
jgi:hypothetical protein